MKPRYLLLALLLVLGQGCHLTFATFENGAAEDAGPDAGDLDSDAGPGLDAGEDAGAPDAGDSPPPPRQLAPLSGSFVTSQRPTLRWELGSRGDGARVELCEDRSCTNIIDTLDATGTEVRPSSDLPAGVVFWRLFATEGATTGTVSSPVWQFRVRGRSADADVDGSFGAELDMNGDGFSDVAISSRGNMWVFFGSPTGLGSSPTNLAPTGDPSIGLAAAAIGDVNGDGFTDLGVGASATSSLSGTAYIYLGSPDGPGSTPLEINGPAPNDRLGSSIAAAGDVNGDGFGDFVVGAAERAYLFFGDAAGPAVSLPLDPPGLPASESQFGIVGSAGDVQNDGYGDVVVGAPGGPDEVAYVFMGTPSATTTSQRIPEPTGTRGRFGEHLANAGDVNGDGYADVIVSAANTNGGDDGVVHVYLGSAGGLATSPQQVSGRPATTEVFGQALTSQGDFDGDGYSDLAVGTGFGDGSVYVFRGFTGGVEASGTRVDGPAGENGRFGSALTGAGDIDGDGYSDLIVGARDLEGGAGSAFIYRGTPAGISALRQVIPRPAGAMQFGQVIAD